MFYSCAGRFGPVWISFIRVLIKERVSLRQESHKLSHDNSQPFRKFQVGSRVLVRDYSARRPHWTEGVVTHVLGPTTYEVHIPDLQLTWKRHVDQMVHCPESLTSTTQQWRIQDFVDGGARNRVCGLVL